MGTPKMPEPPRPIPPPPTPTDPAIHARRKRARAMARSGRADTALTGPRGLVSRGTISTPTLMGGAGVPIGAQSGGGV